MQSPPLPGLMPVAGRIAALVAAIGGVLMLLERLRIGVHGLGAPFIWLFWPALTIVLIAYLAQLPAAALTQSADFLFGQDKPEDSPSVRKGVTLTIAFFLLLFGALLAKNAAYLKSQFEIRWHIAFLNYDLAWHTPAFSLAGNALYQFEIQPPFNTSLAPLNRIAYWVSPDLRIVGSFTIFYVAMGVLLWAVCQTIGLRRAPRAACAGLTALIATVPYGLDHLLPFLPPPFVFVSQSMLTSVYEELGILSLTTILLFFWIGQQRTTIANIAVGVAFAAACYVVLLAYPALAFFSTPVILFYCGALLITSTNIRELWWKLGVSGLLLTVMLATHIPLFFKNLYSYTYGAYFSDLVANTDDRLIIWKNATVLGVFWPDPKVLLLCFVAAVSAVFFAVRGSGAIRRFAIAMLAGEAGVFATGGIIAYLHYPVSLYYSDQLQAPIAVLFFVMPLIFAAGVLGRGFDKALDSFLAQAVKDGKLAPAFSNRRRWYAAAAIVVLAISPLLVPRERPFDNSIYPPAKPPSVQILQNELGLAPGKPFAGRALTLVRQDLPAAATAGTDMNPLLIAVLDVLENHYGRFTGNDHWNDLLNLNIPVFGQYAQWVTPIDFLLLHTFFARKDDIFQKSAFILRAYNGRMARMMGVRYVITDAASIPGSTMVYQQMAGDTPLRLFRVDDTNLGQYSPTKLTRITTAADGLAAIKSSSFDPQQNAVVEEDPQANLVPGTLRSLTVESGPALHIQADSSGMSLLVLPFEYSRCLRLKAADGSAARLIPVNLQQTGLLFDGHADVEIAYSFGPFDQPTCRGDDLARMDRLQVRAALK